MTTEQQREIEAAKRRWYENYGQTNTSGYKAPFVAARHDIDTLLQIIEDQQTVIDAAVACDEQIQWWMKTTGANEPIGFGTEYQALRTALDKLGRG